MRKIITTSWDDGHPLDFKLAALLTKYGLKATFYIPKQNAERLVMSEKAVVELGTQFEIGGHTLTHTRLVNLPAAKVNREVSGCYQWIETITGIPPTSFCFPGGKFDGRALKAVYSAGFSLARTTELHSLNYGRLAPTTLQVYPHSLPTYTKHLAKRRRWSNLIRLLLTHHASNLERLTHFYLTKVEEAGGCFHLWGHSWEIEAHNLWPQLEQLFKIVAFRPGFVYVENKDLVDPQPLTPSIK